MKRILLVAASIVFVCSAACTRTQSVPPPAPAPAVDPTPKTLAEAAAARRSGNDELYEAGLRRIARDVTDSSRPAALSLLGVFLQEKKRWGEAAASFHQAAAANPAISRFIAVRELDSLRQAGQLEPALAIALALQSGSDLPAQDARLAVPLLYTLLRDNTQLNASLPAVQTTQLDEFTERRLVELADALAEAGASEAADRIRMRVLRDYTQGRYTEKLYDQLSAAKSFDKLDYPALLEIADRLGRVNRYDQALDLLNRSAVRFPNASASPYARYVRLRSLFNSRRYSEATTIQFAQGEPYSAPASLLRGRAFWRSGDSARFLEATNQIITTAPASKEAAEARIMLSKYYSSDELDYPRAAKYLQEATAGGAYGSDGENLWNLAWIYTAAGQDQEALATYDQYLRLFPDHDYTTNALFWSGKIHQRRGEVAERDAAFARLVREYPFSYYSYRARQIAGEISSSTAADARVFPQADATANEQVDSRLTTVRALMEAGLEPEAARELKIVSASMPDNGPAAFRLAQAYSEIGEPLKAMGILQRRFRDFVRHGGSDIPPEFWRILFPLPYRAAIEREAAKQNVDSLIVASIIRQESAFDPNVVSNAGAVGLMQIMPNELDKIAAEGGLPPITRSDLFDPETNIAAGAAEFRQKLNRMNHQTLAIAAYNAGEQAVGRWIATTPIEDVDLFIETIPYAETKLYVKNVTRNLFEYRRIYETEEVAAPAQ